MGFLRSTCHFVGAAARAGWGIAAGLYRAWKTRRTAARLVGVVGAAAVRSQARCAVFFSPKGGCTDAVVGAIGKAKSSILVQAYGFTAKPIAAALIAAHRRGVRVRVVLDSEGKNSKWSQGPACAAAGIEVAWDAKHLIMHNKVMVIDTQVVITGSFNFSQSAETGNAENLLIVNNQTIAATYAANWELHRAHSAA